MGLVDQVKNKLNIGNHDDAPTNQGATSTTHHQTSARKSLSLFFSMAPGSSKNHKARFPWCAWGINLFEFEARQAYSPFLIFAIL